MRIKILRQKTPVSAPYWETFDYEGPADSTVAGALYDSAGSYRSTFFMILLCAFAGIAISFGIDLCDKALIRRKQQEG